MADADFYLKAFNNSPPRLFVDDLNDRPYIENFLTIMAVENPGGYLLKLDMWNSLCDQKGVPRFDKVTIVKEVNPAPPVSQTTKFPPEDIQVTESNILQPVFSSPSVSPSDTLVSAPAVSPIESPGPSEVTPTNDAPPVTPQ